MRKAKKLLFLHVLFLLTTLLSLSESRCTSGCDLALASYFITQGQNLTYIASLFGIPFDRIDSVILPYNPTLPSKDSINWGTRIRIPFTCNCINGEYLANNFSYTVRPGDTYGIIANNYSNLTTADWLMKVNSYPQTNIPIGATINATVNCSCGDPAVSRDYGLFLTYPLRTGQTLNSVATELNFTGASLLTEYNPGVDFSSGSGIVFLPVKDSTGSYRPLQSSKGISQGAIAGISIAAVVILVVAGCFSLEMYRRKKRKEHKPLLELPDYEHGQDQWSAAPFRGAAVDRSVEFSYDELVKATDDFSLDKKIGSGGFGAVYYAELRGEMTTESDPMTSMEMSDSSFSLCTKLNKITFRRFHQHRRVNLLKNPRRTLVEPGDSRMLNILPLKMKTAIKKMDVKSTREFLAEIKVLAHVHHLNLVRLIGYCIGESLFLVYEYIENGNLSQHLHGSARQPLSWSSRVQIALDSARGLEYIHEHTVPVYIHRDIKSPNILIDDNFRAKVADFGLAKLAEVGNLSQTRIVGTFGYMPPEYAQLGDVSPKVDVYAFGVVLYELISAKEAIIKSSASGSETKGLVALFDEVLSRPDAKEELRKLIDPRLGGDYPIDAVYNMANLGKVCTQEVPEDRPNMRTVVVSLMTLSSSSTGDWDMTPFREDKASLNLMSGR